VASAHMVRRLSKKKKIKKKADYQKRKWASFLSFVGTIGPAF
jgi:hypothetical protein